jgi:hypothetical protein
MKGSLGKEKRPIAVATGRGESPRPQARELTSSTRRLGSAMVSDVKAGAFEHNAYRLRHTMDTSTALGTLGKRFITKGLATLKGEATLITFIGI